jgi:hypothetical protein
MAIDRIINKGTKGGYVTGNFAAGGYISLNSSNPVVGANSAGETVNEMFISNMVWSCANNVTFKVQRGANTVFNAAGTGEFHATTYGVFLETGSESSANCVVVRSGSGPASIVIKLHKRTSITGGSTY